MNKLLIWLMILMILPIVYGAGSTLVIETDGGDVTINTSIISGTNISCNDVLVDSGDPCNPGGNGTGSNNESVRFGNLVDPDCTGNDFMVGVETNGSVKCDTPVGSGDITAVNTAGKYLTGGAASGDVSLLLNETELNTTVNISIDLRVTQSFMEGLGFNITPELKILFDTIYLNRSGTNANQNINITPYTLITIDPTIDSHVATKGYVDNAVGGVSFDFFLTNQTSDITTYFNLTESSERGVIESSLASPSLGTGDDQLIFNFSTKVGQPEFNALIGGIYDAHIHLQKTTGTKPVTVYWTLSNRTGSTETLILTSEVSDNVGDSSTDYDMHAVLVNETMILDDDRLVFRIYANAAVGGSNAIITVFMEGMTDSHFTVRTTTNAFERIFIRRDGANDFTANFNQGAINFTNPLSWWFGITFWNNISGKATDLANFTNSPGYFNGLENFTGNLTDAKWCLYDGTGTQINCTVEPVINTDSNLSGEDVVGFVGNFTDENNTLVHIGDENLTLVSCLNITGGSDGDFCSDADTGGNPFDQVLNKTSSVNFARVDIDQISSTGSALDIFRDRDNASTNAPLAIIRNNNALDNQVDLHLIQIAPTRALFISQLSNHEGIFIDSDATDFGAIHIKDIPSDKGIVLNSGDVICFDGVTCSDNISSGSGFTNTNESVRMGNVVGLNCTGTNKVTGRFLNGTVICGADATGAAGSLIWIDQGDFIQPNTSVADNVNISGYLNVSTLKVGTGSTFSTLSESQLDVTNIKTKSVNTIAYVMAGNGSDIVAKVDACPTTGCHVVIPNGTYVISSTIALKSNMILEGAGKGTIIQAASGFDGDMITGNGRVSDIIIQNLQLDGDSSNQASGSCIVMNGFYLWYINLWIDDCKEHGLHLNATAASSENRIIGGRYSSDGKNIFVGPGNQDLHIVDVTATGGEYGFYLDGGPAVMSNIISFTNSKAGLWTDTVQHISNARISSTPIGIFIDATQNNIIGLWHGFSVDQVIFSTISNNTIFINTSTGNTAYVNIKDYEGSSGLPEVNITGNGTVRFRMNSFSNDIDTTVAATVTVHAESYLLNPYWELSSEPSNPMKGYIYLDSGINRATLGPGYRRYTGSVWEDIGDAGNWTETSTTMETRKTLTINSSTAARLNMQSANSQDTQIVMYEAGNERWRIVRDNFLPGFESESLRFTAGGSTDVMYLQPSGILWTPEINVSGNGAIGGNLTAESFILQVDPTNHRMYDNSTCIIITGDTSTLEIC